MNYNGEKGYNECSERTNSLVLSALFNQKANQRYHFGHEIKDLILEFGEQPTKGGTTTGKLHRLWLDIKAILSTDQEEKILEEIERGDGQALEDYNRFLNENELPQKVRMIISRQRDQIKSTLHNIERLEEIYD